MHEAGNTLSVDPERDPIQLRAADWVGRLSNSTVSLEDTLAWQDWMKADARHAEAFYRFEQISQAMKSLQAPPRPWRWQLERDEYDGSVPLSEWRERPHLFAYFLAGRRGIAVVAALVLLVACITWATFASVGMSWGSRPQAMLTAVGENRRVDLPDGSAVVLGGASRLEWSFTPARRSLELVRGEALFEVARDAARPFRVRVGNVVVVAVGTAFNVRRASDHTVVAVTEGRVVVEPVTHLLPAAMLKEFKPELRAVRVDAGQETTAGAARIESASRMKDVAAVTSWQTGRLSFRLQPLRYVLEDVNRYARTPIKTADEHVGSLLVSGTVMRDNVDAWVTSLEHAFGLVAVDEHGEIVLHAR